MTPACDLANHKCFVITYLPIVPVDQYMASRDFYFDIRGTLVNQLENIPSILPNAEEILPRTRLPSMSELDLLIRQVEAFVPAHDSVRARKERCTNGLRALRTIVDPQLRTADCVYAFDESRG